MDNRVKFYSWLISLLERRRLTFEEIANEWRDANANPEGEELQLRTFHRYRKSIESQLGICVECSGKADGYRFYLKKDIKKPYSELTDVVLLSPHKVKKTLQEMIRASLGGFFL